MQVQEQKRAITAVDSPSKSLALRCTRTIQQEEQQAARREKNEAASDFAEQLIDKWCCTNEKCINH